MSATTTPITNADDYVSAELASAKALLKKVQIYGTLIVLAVCTYLVVITVRFTHFMQPDAAVEIATGFINGQLEDHRADIVNTVRVRVPAMIQQTPDFLIKVLPTYRGRFEQTFEENLTKYCQSTSAQLGTNLDQYLSDNKELIRNVLASSKDPKAIEKLGPTMHAEILDYLKEKPANGDSIDEQVAKSLAMLKDSQTRLHRLATANDLNADELKTRHAIAVITDTIDKEDLTPVVMPKLSADSEAAVLKATNAPVTAQPSTK